VSTGRSREARTHPAAGPAARGGPLDRLRDACGPHGFYPCSRCTTRFQLAVLSSVGFCISFGIRCNMGLAVLQMTSNATRWTLAPIMGSIHPNLTVAMVHHPISRLLAH